MVTLTGTRAVVFLKNEISVESEEFNNLFCWKQSFASLNNFFFSLMPLRWQ